MHVHPISKDEMKQDRRFSAWWILALLGVVLYLALALYQLDLPGLNYDETLDAAPAAQVVLKQPADSYATIDLFGRRWPLMTMPYVGVSTTYFLTPVFAVFGVSAYSVRGAAIFIGVLILLTGWAFLRRYFDDRVASLSVLLLAVNPSFVFWSRMGAWVQLIVVPMAIGALWLLFNWYRSARGRDLIGACFLLGLALATHIQFAWTWGALFVAWLVLSPWLGKGQGLRRWLWPFEKARLRTWLLALLALLVGLTPLIVFNLQDLGLFTYAAEVFSTAEGDWMTPAGLLFGVPRLAWSAFETYLSGDWFGPSFGEAHRNPLGIPAFFLALIAIVALAATGRLTYSARRAALFVVLIVATALASVVIHSSDSAHHLVVLWPMPQALVSVALFGLADRLALRAAPQRRGVWVVALTLAAVLLVSAELWTTVRYHRTLSVTGGDALFSDAIYQLAADLDQPGAPRAISMDWGFRRNLQILTANRVDPVEWYSYAVPPAPGFLDQLVQLVGSAPGATYLFHPPDATAFPGHWELFQEAAYRNGLEPALIKTYYQRDGTPIIQTYQLQPVAPLFSAPPIAQPLDVQLRENIALLGYDLPTANAQPGGDLPLTLYWQATQPPDKSYKVFVHLFDDQGKLWAQHDSPPVYGARPTDGWQAGEVVTDRFILRVPADIPAGAYHLFIGMYDEATGERLPLVADGVRLQGDTLDLADITVP
jgi:hypothetical protein